jgi:hypothetical protein
MTPAELAIIIQRGRFRQGDEFRLHDDLAALLRRHEIAFEREVRSRIRKLAAFVIGEREAEAA